nr:reverse transcriptase domain-containing protein [Tanacetum cinerariifolium]
MPSCNSIVRAFASLGHDLELTKRLNEHVPKTMEEMMITTTAFIRGEAAAASKKKGHVSWKLKKQIEELVRAGKLSHLIKEIKQGRDQSKKGKKETAVKDKPAVIYMVQSWQRTVNQKVTQSFERVKDIVFPPLTASNGTEGPLVIEAEMGGQMIRRMYINGGDATHSTKAWMNFIIVKSLSPYNGIIRRPGLRAIQVVLSTVHGMLKFPVEGGIVTICSTILMPTESASVITSSLVPSEERTRPANFKVALHPDFPDQEVAIRGTLSDKGRTELCSTLKKNLDIFRLMDKAFEGQIGWNIKLYVDDLVVKSYTEAEMMRDVEETFRTLCKVNMKLNPKKCSFRLAEGVFLGYVVAPEGIKPCPDKIADVLQLPSPRTIKEVQSLNEKLASLNRFLSKSAEKSLLLFQTLKKCIKKSDFHWTTEAKQAFQQLKQHLSELPLLVAPKPQEELIIYLSATYGAISAVLITERGTAQTPIYFISRVLQGLELNYSPMEKLVLSLVFAAKRLRRYFQAHPITVITDQPIKQVMSRPDVAGRLQKWSIMLGEHNITYRPRTSVKGQILADFLIEMPGEVRRGAYIDKPRGSRIYLRAKVLGTYVAKEDNMVKYLEIVKSLVIGFTTFSISQVPQSKNKKTDALSKIASTSFAHFSKQVLVEVLKDKSIKEKEVATVIEEDRPTWMTQLVDYLKGGVLPGDKKEARKLRLKARQYELIEGVLYRRSFLRPWLRCVGPLQAEYVMREIHEGSCSMHAGPRSVVAKAIRLGYYWLTMHKDTRDMIRKCSDCQIHRLRKVKLLIVAMDYFTKWIKARAVATITGGQVKKFVWDNIVCRFGIPGEIISDNGKQFSDNPFKDWCDKLNITQRFASVKHPQSNGLVKRANQSLGEGIKSRLEEGKKNWVEELPHVIWAHRTMIKSSHGDTPFSLTYGTEAVIPTEIGMPTYRTAAVDVVNNDEELRLNLDLLEERHERAVICESKAKSKMTKYYNARVRGVTFKPGDFVYRSNDASHAVAGGKLGPKWEGLYEVTEALGNEAYKLRSMDETILPRT